MSQSLISSEHAVAVNLLGVDSVAFSNNITGRLYYINLLNIFVRVQRDLLSCTCHFLSFFLKIGLIEIGLCIMDSTRVVRKHVHLDKAALSGQGLYTQLWRGEEHQLSPGWPQRPVYRSSVFDWRILFSPRIIV